MKKQLLLALALVATCAASAQTVLETKSLPAGHEMQVVKDQQGRIFKRLVKPQGETLINAGNSMIVDGIKITHPVSSAIHDVKTATGQDKYYDINGTKINGKPSKKGLYIRKDEGKTEKVMF